eukprot:scaffold11076_cov5385-Chaetoceros_neogracile.AAC.14
MAQLYPSFGKGLAPFFSGQWGEYSDFLTFKGGLNPVTGHMYRTNWGIGHSMKEILEAHKGPFTGEGHKAPGTTAPNALATTSYAFGGDVVEVGGVLYARSSKLIPDKANLGFRFPCDGPGRGGAHFIWAFSLMFLFSGRGYWQELIESIVWAHNKLNFAPAIQPRALSITQGRAVGLAHYLLGGIGTTWAFFLARSLSIT